MKNFLYCLVIAMLLCCHTPAESGQKENTNALTGTWKFVADQLLDKNDHIIEQDTAVSGVLIYTADGKMSVQFFWKGKRASMINDSIMKNSGNSTGLGLGNNSWTLDQSRKLIDTYEAYYGDYGVDWKTNVVTHTITGNLRPVTEGTVYKRIFQLRGDSLFLKSDDPAERRGVACVRNNN